LACVGKEERERSGWILQRSHPSLFLKKGAKQNTHLTPLNLLNSQLTNIFIVFLENMPFMNSFVDLYSSFIPIDVKCSQSCGLSTISPVRYQYTPTNCLRISNINNKRELRKKQREREREKEREIQRTPNNNSK
jgi:hypothetical protein